MHINCFFYICAGLPSTSVPYPSQHAVEIVKNLQRLSGIDGDYDNDSGSGSDRIARRRTVFNLEKASKPRRQIGTLDVAFKKRFMKLTSQEANNASATEGPAPSGAGPMLPNRMAMRRETLRALEVRKNSIMAERHKSSMQTLGANTIMNPNGVSFLLVQHKVVRFVINVLHSPPQSTEHVGLPARNARVSNAGINIQNVFNPNGGLSTGASQIYGPAGQANGAYEAEGGSADGNTLRMNPRVNQVSWSNRL